MSRNNQQYSLAALLKRWIIVVALLLIAGCSEKRDINSHAQLWVYKLSDDLHLAMVPLERSLEPLDKAALRAKFPDPQLPPNGEIRERFVFYVPGATAPENPKLLYGPGMDDSLEPLDLNVVSVNLIEPWTAEMHRTWPDAQKDARIGWAALTKPADLAKHPLFEMHGMQCQTLGTLTHGYKPLTWEYGHCLAERTPGQWAIFDFDYHPKGEISTRYYSPDYGGLTVTWSTTYRNFSRWREIDARLWQLIDERNLAKKP